MVIPAIIINVRKSQKSKNILASVKGQNNNDTE
jgi:hypothetical protein